MNMQDLNSVEWGDQEGLQVFLLENALQHQLFKATFQQYGYTPPSFNLFDLDTDNIDDWLLPHQNEHQFFSSVLGLSNPISLLDMNWNNEEQFYDFINDHYNVHAALASTLGLASIPQVGNPPSSLSGYTYWTNSYAGNVVNWINQRGLGVFWT